MRYIILAAQNLTNEEVKMQAYCVKCKKKVEIKNPRAIKMKNKRPATQGFAQAAEPKSSE
jgi:hypothetical protein